MEHLYECSTRHLTIERSERVKYKVEHEKRYFISTSNHVSFGLSYKQIDNVLDDFPKISEDFRRFPKVIRRAHESFWKISEHFRRLSRTTEDCRRLSRKIRICFYHTPTKGQFKESNMISVKSSIFLLPRIWKIRHPSPGCGFVWILRVVYFPVKRSCLYVK